MHQAQQTPWPGRPAPGRLGTHARLWRSLRYQEPRLLHHPRRTARRARHPSARASRRLWAPARHGRRRDCRHQLALCRARVPAVLAADRRCGMTRLLLTVPEAAEALAISRSKLYELIAAGLIRSVRIDGSRRVPVEALQTYVAQLLDHEETTHAQAS